MNKSELIAAVAERSELSQKECATVVNALIDTITAEIKKHGEVALTGFGTFLTKDRPERKGHNPATGEEITIKAATLPVFKPGKGLKDAAEGK